MQSSSGLVAAYRLERPFIMKLLINTPKTPSESTPSAQRRTILGRRKKLINNSAIPQHAIASIARCILPDIFAFYESDEGQRAFAEWKGQRKRSRGASVNVKYMDDGVGLLTAAAAERRRKGRRLPSLSAYYQLSKGLYSVTFLRYASKSPLNTRSAYPTGSLFIK